MRLAEGGGWGFLLIGASNVNEEYCDPCRHLCLLEIACLQNGVVRGGELLMTGMGRYLDQASVVNPLLRFFFLQVLIAFTGSLGQI